MEVELILFWILFLLASNSCNAYIINVTGQRQQNILGKNCLDLELPFSTSFPSPSQRRYLIVNAAAVAWHLAEEKKGK